jgi:hypothetical protein
MTITSTDTKAEITGAFSQLLAKHQSQTQVATKEEQAQKQIDQQTLAKATQYTVKLIVNQLAQTQLDFGSTINQLSEKLTSQADKLEELTTAIAVANNNLKQLEKVRLAADALDILKQEHQQKLTAIKTEASAKIEQIEFHRHQIHKQWQKQQQEFEQKQAEDAANLTKQREQEKTDYQYQTERQQQIDRDDYQEYQRQQERELTQLTREKTKDWTAREKVLNEQKHQYEQHQKLISTFEEKLKQQTNQAREKAIKEADLQAKIKADLIEKEWLATQQGYQLKIKSLQETMVKQAQQIEQLITQLQEATTQTQNLALKAFSNNS